MSEIVVGGFYYDCAYHPVLCTESDEEGVAGISLVDGSMPRSCSLKHCAPKPLTLKQALWIKKNGPYVGDKRHLETLQKTGACGAGLFKKWWEEGRK